MAAPKITATTAPVMMPVLLNRSSTIAERTLQLPPQQKGSHDQHGRNSYNKKQTPSHRIPCSGSAETVEHGSYRQNGRQSHEGSALLTILQFSPLADRLY
jgi:hypothetical protein